MTFRGRHGAALGVLATLGLAAAPALAKDIVLNMAVPDWPPTRIMQDLANERYQAPSGNNVKLQADFIPWPNYYERLAASLTSASRSIRWPSPTASGWAPSSRAATT